MAQVMLGKLWQRQRLQVGPLYDTYIIHLPGCTCLYLHINFVTIQQ